MNEIDELKLKLEAATDIAIARGRMLNELESENAKLRKIISDINQSIYMAAEDCSTCWAVQNKISQMDWE